MRDILDEIVAYKLKEVEKYKKELSQVFLESRVEIIRKSEVVSMSLAIKSSNTGIIAEFNRKSPSKGWIASTRSTRLRSAVPLPSCSLPPVSPKSSVKPSSRKHTN